MTEPLQLRGVDNIINPSYCVEVNLDSSVQGEGSLSVTSNQTRAPLKLHKGYNCFVLKTVYHPPSARNTV